MPPCDPINKIVNYTKADVRDREIFCSLDFSDLKDVTFLSPHQEEMISTELKNDQSKQASNLSLLFKNGGENAAIDVYKSSKYDIQAKQLPSIEDEFQFNNQNLNYFINRFNHWRIFIIRIHLLIKSLNKSAPGVLPPFASFLGFAYGPLFLTEIIAIFKATFSSNRTEVEKQYEEKYGHFALLERRFKNAAQKDDRLFRVFNAGFWFSVNVLTFSAIASFAILAAPVAAVVMACATVVDILQEATIGIITHRRHQHYINGIQSKIDKNKEKLQHLMMDESLRQDDHSQSEATKYAQVNLRLRTIKAVAQEKLDAIDHKNLVHFGKTMVILPGLMMMLFPPTLIPGIIFTALGLVFSLYETAKNLVDGLDYPAPLKQKSSVEYVKEGTDTNDIKNKLPQTKMSADSPRLSHNHVSLEQKISRQEVRPSKLHDFGIFSKTLTQKPYIPENHQYTPKPIHSKA